MSKYSSVKYAQQQKVDQNWVDNSTMIPTTAAEWQKEENNQGVSGPVKAQTSWDLTTVHVYDKNIY